MRKRLHYQAGFLIWDFFDSFDLFLNSSSLAEWDGVRLGNEKIIES